MYLPFFYLARAASIAMLVSLILFDLTAAPACTTAVISGKVTVDGRPILWKNRDTKSSLHNNVVLFSGGKYQALAVVNAGNTSAAWMGVNSVGFCIENSLSLDLAGNEERKGPGNGAIMKRALLECKTVEDFERLLDETNQTGRATVANFGVIDSHGGAAMFETGPNRFTMFDANDPAVAPHGYIVRSNFATTARHLSPNPRLEDLEEIYSADRYLRACDLMQPALENGLCLSYLLRNVARDLSCQQGQAIPGSVNDISGTLPLTIKTDNTISRTTTVSAVVFHGVRPDEDPSLTTMWAMMGDPKFSIAVPCFVASGEVADPLQDSKGAEIGEIALTLRDWSLTANRSAVYSEGFPGIWSDLWTLEDELLEETLKLKDELSRSGVRIGELKSLHGRAANRAMLAMRKELVEAKEFALGGFDGQAGKVTQMLKVAVYDHSGGTANGPKNLQSVLDHHAGFELQRVSPEQIRQGILDRFDVVILPGGSGSKQSSMLEASGRAAIQGFVSRGGGYVGICAGAYLASSHYDWSLNLINTRIWDRVHWARGTGMVQLELSAAGKSFFDAEHALVNVYYGQGPLMIPGKHPNLSPYEVLAAYTTEVAKKGAPVGAMQGTHAIVRGNYGKGRVICFSPHPESGEGPEWMVRQGVRWAGGH